MPTPLNSLQEMLITPTIPVGFLADVLEGIGIESEASGRLLQESGLSRHSLEVGQHRLSVVEYSRFIQRVMKQTDDLFLGFLDKALPMKAFGVFAIGAAGCRSLQSLVDYGNLYFSMFTDQFRWVLERDSGEVRLKLEFDERRDISYRFIYQSIVLIWQRLISWFVGEEIRPRAIHFRFSESEKDEHLHYLFGKDIVFSASANQLVCDERLADTPFSATQDEIRQMLKDNQNMMLVRTSSDPFTRQTRRLLVMNRENGWLRQSDIARQFNLSENLYWRKLKKEDATYNDILNTLKRDLALRLLSDPNLPMESVAEQLHFSELSAFDKAFKKWTGRTPGNYRRQLLNDHPRKQE